MHWIYQKYSQNFTLYFLYGILIISFSYLLSFVFKKSKDAAQWYDSFLNKRCGAIIGFSISIMYLVITFIFQYNVPNWINYILSFFPLYSLFYGLSILGLALNNDSPITFISFFSFKGYSLDFFILYVIMVVESIFFISLILYFFI